jgi:hypothetical protein
MLLRFSSGCGRPLSLKWDARATKMSKGVEKWVDVG